MCPTTKVSVNRAFGLLNRGIRLVKKNGKIFHNFVDNFDNLYYTIKGIEAWLSLVERCVRDAEVVGSNPVASILR